MPAILNRLFLLDGHVALVTGGSSGIGQAMAAALADAGAAVVLVARRKGDLEQTARLLRNRGARADHIAADLSERDEVERVAILGGKSFGEPDILVNAAGVGERPALPDIDAQQWDHVLAVNLTAPFLLGQRLAPGMAQRGWGRIINVVSQQAVRAFAHSGAYGVSKAALAALTRSQAEAWSASGVCCNAIAPGVVHTRLTQALFNDPDRAAALAARTMVHRNSEPADLYGVTAFLASPASDYMTAQVIFVDGGLSVH